MKTRTMVLLGALAMALFGCGGGAAPADDTSSSGEAYEDDTSGGATPLSAEPMAPAEGDAEGDGVYDIEE